MITKCDLEELEAIVGRNATVYLSFMSEYIVLRAVILQNNKKHFLERRISTISVINNALSLSDLLKIESLCIKQKFDTIFKRKL